MSIQTEEVPTPQQKTELHANLKWRLSNFVIGLTGSLGSGCTEISKALENNTSFCRLTLSDPIKEEFRQQNKKEPTLEDYGDDWRRELQNIGNNRRKENPSYWVDKITEIISQKPGTDIVIDGIRNELEVNALREIFPNFFLVAAYADYPLRWERVKGIYDFRENIFIRDESRDREDEDRFGQTVSRCVSVADYIVVNNENLDQPKEQRRNTLYDNKLKDVIALMKLGEGRGPTKDEVFMTLAITLSHASMCLKRHVGAAIVNEDKIPLSTGYNENPIGMLPCTKKPQKSCYKDDIVQNKLERMLPFYCPNRECGKMTTEENIQEYWKCPHCGENFLARFFPSRGMEFCTAIHAEERAIRNLGDRDAKGCTMYVNTFPCFQCARYIKDVGIKRIMYVEAYPLIEARKFLEKNNIEVIPFEGFKARAFNMVFRQID